MKFTKLAVGDLEVYAFQSWAGHLVQCSDLFPDASPEELKEAQGLYPDSFSEDGVNVRLAHSVAAVRQGGELTLVDTGLPHDNPEALFLNSFREAGFDVGDVTQVVLTHRDTDHVGGTVLEGKPAFPNARYFIGQTEYDGYKVDPVRNHFATYIGPLEEAGVLDVVPDQGEFAPGISMLFTPGHRPGATSVLFGGAVLALGDTWHSPAQIRFPHWTIKFDSDPALAVTTRSEIVKKAEAEKWVVAVPHTVDFGLGRIESGAWMPLIGLEPR